MDCGSQQDLPHPSGQRRNAEHAVAVLRGGAPFTFLLPAGLLIVLLALNARRRLLTVPGGNMSKPIEDTATAPAPGEQR